MKVYFVTPQEKVFMFELDPKDPIKWAKMKIKERTGCPLTDQDLYFKGKELRNSDTFEKHGVENEATVQLIMNNDTTKDIMKECARLVACVVGVTVACFAGTVVLVAGLSYVCPKSK